METYVFDGSFEGLLTAVFEFYERKPTSVRLVSKRDFQPTLIGEFLDIHSDQTKARRVFDGLEKKAGTDFNLFFYTAFLSENAKTYQDLFDLGRYIFDNPQGAERNFGHPAVNAVAQMQRSVNRERHRMKAFVRFQETAEGIFYAAIEPDFNVLPLISEFFKNRYADQRWMIYDIRRNYGLYYGLTHVTEVVLEQLPETGGQSASLERNLLAEREDLYGLLWSDYFKSTNIEARKNVKLHIRHVPRRYWKYLTEKKPLG